MPRHASTAVKTAALLALAPAALLPMKVAAQQVASSQHDLRSDPAYAHCERIKDVAKSTQCYVDTEGAILKARIRTADQKIADAKARQGVANQQLAENERLLGCIAYLKEKKAEGVPLDPARLNREKGCDYAAELGMR